MVEMGLKTSRPRSLLHIQDKEHLAAYELQQVAESDEPFVQVQTYPPGASEPQQVFLDTSLQQILYGEPIGEDSPSSNLSTVWIMKKATSRRTSEFGPYIISNVTTPIGQAQTSPEQTEDKTYDINVLPVSTNQEIVWNTEFRDGKYALYYDQPGAQRLYALPEKSDDPNRQPPRDTLIKAVAVDSIKQNVFVFNFSYVDSIKYKYNMQRGIDVFLRPQSK